MDTLLARQQDFVDYQPAELYTFTADEVCIGQTAAQGYTYRECRTLPRGQSEPQTVEVCGCLIGGVFDVCRYLRRFKIIYM